MTGGEKFITQELERLEKEIVPKEYCFWGKMIKLAYGPASDKFPSILVVAASAVKL